MGEARTHAGGGAGPGEGCSTDGAESTASPSVQIKAGPVRAALCLPDIHVLRCYPQNVPILGERIFEEVIKLR